MFRPAEIYQYYSGPIRNRWGYVTEFAIIDDLMIAKTDTPYNERLVRYFFDEQELDRYFNLLDQDRRF